MAKIETVPIVISTMSGIPKGLLRNNKLLGPSEHLYKPMQKTVLPATVRSIRSLYVIYSSISNSSL